MNYEVLRISKASIKEGLEWVCLVSIKSPTGKLMCTKVTRTEAKDFNTAESNAINTIKFEYEGE